jgi:APA family basic amino acid/polyamine antiporter
LRPATNVAIGGLSRQPHHTIANVEERGGILTAVSNGRGTSEEYRTGLARELTAGDGFAIVTGSVIGSGIFLVPGVIALQLHSLPWVLGAWIAGGLLSLAGALSLAEMGAALPAAGGLYAYLREAYGDVVAFLYGWGLITMIQTGSIATLAAGFGLYLGQLVHLSVPQTRLVSAGLVLLLTALNLMSLRHAKHLQNAGNAAKLLGLALLAGFLFWRGHAVQLNASWSGDAHASALAFGISLIAVLWAYEGWHVVSFTAAEFRKPQKDLPRSLILGTATVAAVYLVLNLAYYAVLGRAGVVGVPSAAASAVHHAYGGGVTQLVSFLILTSILGAMNGMVLTGPRVYYAMAHDGMFFRALARTTRTRVPAIAIVVQGVWAAVLSLMGNFEQLLSCVVFTAWIFYGLAVAGVIIVRRRHPERVRAFKTPGYPVVPLLFVAAAAGVAWSTIASQPGHAAIGAMAILTGIPVYYIFRGRLASAVPEIPTVENNG